MQGTHESLCSCLVHSFCGWEKCQGDMLTRRGCSAQKRDGLGVYTVPLEVGLSSIPLLICVCIYSFMHSFILQVFLAPNSIYLKI